MKARHMILTAAGALAFFSLPAWSHDVPNMTHSHAFQQTGYGTWRQGHYVNGQQGSIIVWSPRNYTGYQAGAAVKFARPKPMNRAPRQPVAKTQSQSNPAITYGKK